MPFEIDTGIPDRDPLNTIPDWMRDMCADPDDWPSCARAYAQHMIGQMAVPVKLDTVRKHLLMSWAFLRELSTTDPASFDAVFTEYAERAFQHACASAPDSIRHPTPQIGQIDKGKQDEPILEF